MRKIEAGRSVRGVTTAERAAKLLRLHTDPELLIVVNVWDVVSATVVAGVPGTKALATASHCIAATFGYPDHEVIPRDLMVDMCRPHRRRRRPAGERGPRGRLRRRR